MAFGHHHRVTGGLPEIERKIHGIEQHRRVLEMIARVDSPAAVGADVHRAVITIDGEDFIGGV